MWEGPNQRHSEKWAAIRGVNILLPAVNILTPEQIIELGGKPGTCFNMLWMFYPHYVKLNVNRLIQYEICEHIYEQVANLHYIYMPKSAQLALN